MHSIEVTSENDRETAEIGSAEPAAPSAPRKLPAIQILRGLAAALVVFYHFSGLVATHNIHFSWLRQIRVPRIGAAGVDIFFVISGFIMFYTTVRKGGINDAKVFLLRRVLRIYPLYWFWTSVLLLIVLSRVIPTTHIHSVGFFISSYLLIPVFNGVDFHPFLDQGWTLSFEMLFYCVFSVGLWLDCRRSILTFLSISFVALFCLGLCLPGGNGIKYLLSNTLIIEFLYGAGLAKLFLRTYHRAPAKPKWDWIPAGLIVLGFCLLLTTPFVPSTNPEFLISGQWRFVFWGIPSALIVFGFASWKQERTHPALVYLGDASYSTYLAHIFFLGGVRLALERFSSLRSLPVDAEILAATAVTILLTLPAYQWLERPLTSSFRSAVAPKGARTSLLPVLRKAAGA